jgi:1-acyl-sn-glycerol-3-phosphate acyltransferase
MLMLIRALLLVLLYTLLFWLGALSLVWNLIALLLLPLLPRQRAQAIGRAGIAFGYRLFWASAEASGMMSIDATALDVLRHEPGGLIIAANHPAMLDALLIVARLPRGVCIMKADLMRNIFLGAGARLARYICNDSPRLLIRRSVATLREGGQLVLFPEGTRTVHGKLNPFLPGITLIASMASVPIQTVIIETRSPYLGKGWPIWRLPPVPIVFRLRLGERFTSDSCDHHAMLARLETYFRKELGA